MVKRCKIWIFFTLSLFSMTTPQSQAGIFSQGPYEINVDGASRKSAEVYLPREYDEKASWPLVILLHGFKASGPLQEAYFGMSYRVSKKGFVLLIPEGTKNSEGKRFWNATEACCDFEHSQVNDEGYILDLISKTQKKYRIDSKRIYIVGHSNGGFMAHRLACNNAHLFAGIASLAGATYTDPANCRPSEPVSVLEFHALDDPTIRYMGATEPNFKHPSAPETVRQWRLLNECPDQYRTEGPLNFIWSIPGKDTTLQTWSKCRDNSEVALWTIKKYKSVFHSPHAPWLTYDVTNQILDFLFSHHK